MEENYGGILSGRHAGDVETGVDLGIETALAMRVEDLTKELEASKANATNWNDRYSQMWEKHNSLQEKMKTVLTELVNENSLDTDIAKRIADACDLELTREVRFSGTISFSGEVEISIFEDFDKYEMSIDSVDLSYNGEAIYDLQTDIEDAEEDSY